MRKEVVAQMPMMQAAPLASNPASGVNNIPLTQQNGEAVPMPGADPMQGAADPNGAQAPGTGPSTDAIDPGQITKTLNGLASAHTSEAPEFKGEIEQFFEQSKNPAIKQKLQAILAALEMTNDPKRQTVDPSTGKKDPTAGELAARLAEEIDGMSKQSSVKPYNHFRFAGKVKKKTRGNPFRVLMGQVGKLLDHGMEKRDIVRYLDKKGMFGKETIEKAVDIVRDYNKKNRRDDNTMKEETKEDIKHRLSSVDTEKKAVTKRDEEGEEFNWNIDFREKGIPMDTSDANNEKKKPTKAYNFYKSRLANDVTIEIDAEEEANKLKDTGEKEVSEDEAEFKESKAGVYNHSKRTAQKSGMSEVYTHKPDFKLRSTTELMSRACFLSDLLGWNDDKTHNEGRKAADTKGASSELKSIKEALKDRGYDEQEIKFKGK